MKQKHKERHAIRDDLTMTKMEIKQSQNSTYYHNILAFFARHNIFKKKD